MAKDIKRHKGTIIAKNKEHTLFKLFSGKVVTKKFLIDKMKKGRKYYDLKNAEIGFIDQGDNSYLRSVADTSQTNNLENVPETKLTKSRKSRITNWLVYFIPKRKVSFALVGLGFLCFTGIGVGVGYAIWYHKHPIVPKPERKIINFRKIAKNDNISAWFFVAPSILFDSIDNDGPGFYGNFITKNDDYSRVDAYHNVGMMAMKTPGKTFMIVDHLDTNENTGYLIHATSGNYEYCNNGEIHFHGELRANHDLHLEQNIIFNCLVTMNGTLVILKDLFPILMEGLH